MQVLGAFAQLSFFILAACQFGSVKARSEQSLSCCWMLERFEKNFAYNYSVMGDIERRERSVGWVSFCFRKRTFRWMDG